MHIPGRYLLNNLLRDGNAIVMLGPLVLKRIGGLDARRKFASEIASRRLLAAAGVQTVPVIASIAPARLLVMARAKRPTLDRELNDEKLQAFEQHVLQVAALPFAPIAGGYFWVDADRRIRPHPTFAAFLLNEFDQLAAVFARAFPQFDCAALRALLGSVPDPASRVVIPTDIAPKNVVFCDGVFTHLDLETVLVGPPEFLFVKAAMNMANDLGSRYGAPVVRNRLLASCRDAATARASIGFALVRRMLYELNERRADARPAAALRALLDARSLEDIISELARIPATRASATAGAAASRQQGQLQP